MRDYLKEFSGDVIGDFLVDNDISEILTEGTAGRNAPTDDGPPTFYKNLTNYKKETKLWIGQLQNELGWKVLSYILSKGAMDPEEDYTMSYRAMAPVSYGEVNPYKEHLRNVMDNLGWTVLKWMGVDKDQQMGGKPVPAGVDSDGRVGDETRNTSMQDLGITVDGEDKPNPNFDGDKTYNTTKQAKGLTVDGENKPNPKFSGDKKRPRLHVEKYSPLSKDWWSDELRELITEGGAYGHMAHPFDDKDLTFKDLKNIIDMGLGGRLDREDNVTERLDGQNLMISWRA